MDVSFFDSKLRDVPNPFQSFWMGGYECSDKLNAFGIRVDLLRDTGHLELIAEDYAHLKPYSISTVREGIRWSDVEKQPYSYNWDTVAAMLEAGREGGIQQVWDLCHFGFPDDLSPLHPMFARRFAAMCRSFVHFYRQHNPYGPLIVTPINEVSFLSWLGGDARGTSPYCMHNGWEVKYGLMRAYIEGVAAMKEIDSNIIIMATEPLISVVPPLDATEEDMAQAAADHELQYQALDMLTGHMCPELGGRPEYLDILGFNFYYNNQWEMGYRNYLPWANEGEDPRWQPLRTIIMGAYQRYDKPFVLAETSHPGEHRPHWIAYIAEECAALLQMEAPLYGVCLYPIIDRPDWDHTHIWHNSGLWDAELQDGAPPRRVLHEEYATALLTAQEEISNALAEYRENKAAVFA